MPPANGHAPLWTSASFDIQNPRKSQPKRSKIHQVGSQNPPSWAPNPLKSMPWGILEGAGDHMGPSWAQDGPKSSHRPPKADSWTPPGPPKLEPKINKIRS